ncbi:hypothetical protein SPOG_04022 [Schizosaccharomyces cryophilus OY26]|uniref:Uncharacterized protein n=1 Tax=Schizosaccharomyces cryophilus (strain OY26 / ATCC MYA-4695 / CBS 11777 / NBRC 106824 / NRRL Y48691) TaxID=653667 RepID=S9W6F6_SCHCR|nr:uncharacterized protein SPOG_04022 [Schizosaccharomyces cryophilus OY26]EPY54129.1 hypothetical protein SPOG_04022 [Schizosaccharomyces cryophilus OY26]
MSYFRSGIIGFLSGLGLSYAGGVQSLLSSSKQTQTELQVTTELIQKQTKSQKEMENRVKVLEDTASRYNTEEQVKEWKTIVQNLHLDQLELQARQKQIEEALGHLLLERQTKLLV